MQEPRLGEYLRYNARVLNKRNVLGNEIAYRESAAKEELKYDHRRMAIATMLLYIIVFVQLF